VDPRFLILETSGRVGSVALTEGTTVLATRRLDEARRHARDLAPAVADLLQQVGWKPRDLQAVGVSRGPGSYTGLRVGVMSAKAFAYAAGCALLALDTFTAIALQSPDCATLVDVIADAQQDKIYIQRFQRHSPQQIPVAATTLATRSFADWLAEGPAFWVSGPALRLHRARFPSTIQLVAESEWEPRVESLLRLALGQWQAGERADLFALEPLYLRPSSAEEKWQSAKSSGTTPDG
jgi:tRNA threonylcarbamoyladenosine biosynthesis protein TsaB